MFLVLLVCSSLCLPLALDRQPQRATALLAALLDCGCEEGCGCVSLGACAAVGGQHWTCIVMEACRVLNAGLLSFRRSKARKRTQTCIVRLARITRRVDLLGSCLGLCGLVGCCCCGGMSTGEINSPSSSLIVTSSPPPSPFLHTATVTRTRKASTT